MSDTAANPRHWQLLFDNMLDGFAYHEVILNEQGIPCDYRFLEVNPSFERITGLKACNIVGKTVLEVLPDTESVWIQNYGNVALSGEPMHFESFNQSLNSHFEVTAYSPKKGFFACHFRDVTERVQTLERFTRINEVLLRLGGNFSDNVNSILSLCGELLGADKVGYIRQVRNESLAQSVWQKNPERVLHCRWDAEFCHDLFQRIGTGDPEIRIEEHSDQSMVQTCIGLAVCNETEIKGSLCAGFLKKTEVSKQDQRIFGVLASALRQMEIRRNLEDQIQHVQKLESLGVLAGGIAHDFNNMLTGILGNTDLALQELPQTSVVRPWLDDVLASSRRAADLCRQLLAYSGKGRFQLMKLNISEIVNEMAEMMEVSISKKARVRNNCSTGLPLVEADPSQMQQVIMNLIINAAESLQEKNGSVTLNTGVMDCDSAYLQSTYIGLTVPPGRYVYLEISDTGCGMDPETLKHLFDPFYSTKFTGRGLGLAAVLGIVKGHKGTIKVYSEPDRGTTIKVLLPAVEGEAEEPSIAATAVTREKLSGSILLVDDEPAVRRMASRVLQTMGLTVTLAANGHEALEMFRDPEMKFDLILLDLTMPRMDGEECFRELRRVNTDVAVVMMSGYNEQEVSQRFSGKGVTAFIQKPFRVQQLNEVIKDLLPKKSTLK